MQAYRATGHIAARGTAVGHLGYSTGMNMSIRGNGSSVDLGNLPRSNDGSSQHSQHVFGHPL